MAVPTWTVGEVLTASDVNTWFVPLAGYKTSATTRFSTTTLANDSDLTVTVAANAVYDVRLSLGYYTGVTSGIGFKFGFTAPSGVTGHWQAVYRIGGDTPTGSGGGPASTVEFSWSQYAGTGGQWASASTPGDGNSHSVLVDGTLITSSTAGTFALQWAQDVSNANTLQIDTGAKLVLRRIG